MENGNIDNHDGNGTQQEEFLLTELLRTVNRKLIDGIVGVFRRAWNVLLHLFSKRMLDFFMQGILVVILGAVLLAIVFWPFLLMAVCPGLAEGDLWTIIGVVWFLFIGAVGVWQGFRNGAKLRQRWKAWRARRQGRNPPPLPPRK